MNFFNRIRGARNKVEFDDPLLSALLHKHSIDRDTAMKLPVVSKNVGLICDIISCIPVKLYTEETDENGNRKVTEVQDTRADLLNKDTRDTLSGVEFKRAIVEDYLLGKGGYAYINRRGNKVLSLHYVRDSDISILKNDDPIFKAYSVNINGHDYEPYNFIKVLRNTKDGASGNGIIYQVSTAIESAYETMKYQLDLVKTGGNKKGFLLSKHKLTKEAMDTLKAAWRNMYESNTQKMIVLNDGIDFKESSNSSVEMQLNQSKASLNSEIDAIFHYSDDADKFFRNSIMPILSEFEASLNRDLLLEREKKELFWKFDTKEITKGSLKERYEAYQIAKNTGWLTPNEIRFEENKEKIDGLDIIAMNLADVIFDVNTGNYFTPNLGDERNLGEGGSDE